MNGYLMVLLGGGVGSLTRYLVAQTITMRTGARFPFGTVAINITGSFIIGFLMTLFTQRWSGHPNLRLLLVTGFLGGYTTFSSFEWETLSLVSGGGAWLGLINVVGSVGVGYLAVWLGATLARS